MPILKILERREKNYPVEITEQVSAAWEKYSERNSTPKRPSHKRAWVLSAAAVAAAICIVMAIPRTVGAESIFDMLFRWTGGVFEFFDPERDKNMPQPGYEFMTDNPGLQQLYDKVTELGVTEQVVPMWVPEELELFELKVIPMPDGTKVHALFVDDGLTVSFMYWISVEKTPVQYEKEEDAVDVFESAGITYFIMENEGCIIATWAIPGVECSINANTEKESVHKMIQSIHRRNME